MKFFFFFFFFFFFSSPFIQSEVGPIGKSNRHLPGSQHAASPPRYSPCEDEQWTWNQLRSLCCERLVFASSIYSSSIVWVLDPHWEIKVPFEIAKTSSKMHHVLHTCVSTTPPPLQQHNSSIWNKDNIIMFSVEQWFLVWCSPCPSSCVILKCLISHNND